MKSDHKIDTPGGAVSALLDLPDGNPRFLCVLAHGAGAGMRQASLESFATRLSSAGAAVLRYNFPWMEAGKGGVDKPAVAEATVRAAVAAGRMLVPDVAIVAGGRSFGGRMTSGAQASAPMDGVMGLCFLAFPLHPPGKPGVERAEHLDRVKVPMLFLQGTRDEFAEPELLGRVIERLGRLATLELIEDADHSFKAPKRVGTPAAIEARLVDRLVSWAGGL
ncbi:MAG: alpha/beta hydrolase family protein [Gemmatimonadota bacterium]